MEISYEIVDKQCAWQQDRSPEGGDGRPCGWVQRWTAKLQGVTEWLLVLPGGIPAGGVGEVKIIFIFTT